MLLGGGRRSLDFCPFLLVKGGAEGGKVHPFFLLSALCAEPPQPFKRKAVSENRTRHNFI
jgi:hypothetical protein